MTLRRVAFAIGVGVLGASGAFVFIYLYRWEWNRAIVAGIFFLAAEIALAAVAILDRLARLDAQPAAAASQPVTGSSRSARFPRSERRIPRSARSQALASARTGRSDNARETGGRGSEPEVSPIGDAAPGDPFEPARPFAWLSEHTYDLNVFVPVLLGAGAMLSALAWVVERVAAATAMRTQSRSSAAIAGTPGVTGTPRFAGIAPRRARVRMRHALALLAAGALTVVGIDALGDLTQTRPDTVVAGSVGVIVFEVSTRTPGGEAAAAQRLWTACADAETHRTGTLTAAGGRRFRVETSPAPGTYAFRRLRGCLEDATLDRIRARIVGFRRVP